MKKRSKRGSWVKVLHWKGEVGEIWAIHKIDNIRSVSLPFVYSGRERVSHFVNLWGNIIF